MCSVIMSNPSAKLKSTAASRSFFDASLASAQGADSSIYLLAEPITSHTALNALLYSSLSMKPATFPLRLSAESLIVMSRAVADAEEDGIVPSKYFSIIEMVLLRRFPRSFARSLFILRIMASLEKSPSSPNVTSRMRKYLNWSTPNSRMMSTGLTTFPRLFDIFSPSTVHHPCAKIVFGGSISRAFSIVDQYTEWVVSMSLPIRWESAGHHLLNLSPLVR